MGTHTAIDWTDHTFNPWWGCHKIAPGCTNCYAAALAKRAGKEWGTAAPRYKTSNANWREPLKWNQRAARAGIRRRVFCASMADVFEEHAGPVLDFKGRHRLARAAAWSTDGDYIPTDLHIGRDLATLDDLRAALFRLIDATPWLDWLLLTKRPERIRECWPVKTCDCDRIAYAEPHAATCPARCPRRPNVWLGTSVSDHPTAAAAIPQLKRCRHLAARLFISAEPLLGPINFRTGIYEVPYGAGRHRPHGTTLDGIDWIIVGGESGPHRRDDPALPQWVEHIANQCVAASVPVFVKQDSAPQPGQKGRLSARLWSLKQFPRVNHPQPVEALHP